MRHPFVYGETEKRPSMYASTTFVCMYPQIKTVAVSMISGNGLFLHIPWDSHLPVH